MLEALNVIEKQKSMMMLAMQRDTVQAMLKINMRIQDIQEHIHSQRKEKVLK